MTITTAGWVRKPAAITEKQHDPSKRLANLRARCALKEVQLHVIDDDRGRPLYICSRWAMTRSHDTLDALAAWVSRVDGLAE